MAQAQLTRISYSHRDLADYMIANPAARARELAERYGYTENWISIVKNSDAFQAILAQRAAELKDPVLIASLEERFKGVLALSMERLGEKLSSPNVSDSTVLKAAEFGAKALGCGGHAPIKPQEPVSIEDLAHRIVAVQRQVTQPGGQTYEADQVTQSSPVLRLAQAGGK